MKNLFEKFLLSSIILMFSLRYRIRVSGLDRLEKNRDPHGGILFLPNHPTLLIDPTIITTRIMQKFSVRPVVVDFMYYMPFVNFFLRRIKAIPLPSFSITTNTHKLRRMDIALNEIITGLDRGDNFLFYPAGKVKLSAKEQIGGASGLHKILKEAKHYNIVLVRITGLWGSSFSKANAEKAPVMAECAWKGIKATLKNLIFFNPRRDVHVEFLKAPQDFPYEETKTIQNRWLENWYNKEGEFGEGGGESTGEPLYLVPYSVWNKKIEQISHAATVDEDVDLEKVPSVVRQKVIAMLAEMSDVPAKNIVPKMSLATDLGIDSLDAAEIAIFLEEQFNLKDIPGDELTSVKKILGVASGQIHIEKNEEAQFNLDKWKKTHSDRIRLPEGDTLAEVFLNTSSLFKSNTACADERSGVLSYKDLRMRAILLAEKFKNLEGDFVGILLPSSSMAMILVFALHLAGKIPVMINWTIGSRHVNSVINATDLKVCLSSWAFLDRLSNVDLGNLVDCLVQLEDLREKITFKDKLKALYLSKRSNQHILRRFNIDKRKQDDTAVLLFTSGSEGAPKGVPLSHKNILSNLNSIVDVVNLYPTDVFYSILPPFHSFGFTVCGMAPLLLGLRAIFYPNPTDSVKIAKGIQKWNATIICGAPSFLKNILKAAKHDELKSLRLTVTGAEKAPEELYRQAEKLGIGDSVLEGYGITECSPVLTINYPGEERKGVGRPLPSVQIEVIDPDTYEKVGVNKQGLILAHGPNVFSGYLNRTLDPFVRREGVNWYITGDLGYLDEKGRLTITGRIKRFVKVGSEMISLGSIEEAFTEERINAGDPSLEFGPVVAACARENPGEKPKFYLFTTYHMSLDKANVILKQMGFSNLVRIHHVEQIPNMPLMGSGKVNYQLLVANYLNEKEEN